MPHLVDCTMFWSRHGGGVGRYLRAKRARLPTLGWRHTIVAPGVHGPDGVDSGGVPLPASGGYRLPMRRGHGTALIEALQPDIIEAADPYRLAWSARDAARRLGIPAVAYCHSDIGTLAATALGDGTVLGRAARRLAQRYLRHVYEGFDLVLAPSVGVCRMLSDLGVARVERQRLGVDTGVFRPSRRDPGWRRQLGLPDDARLLLYVGRFAPEKHLQVLADAATLLGPPYWLLALGAGPRPPRGERVRLLPYCSDAQQVAVAIASVDAFVHAGDQETFGLSLLEAMACGTPVAARGAGGLGEQLSGGRGVAVHGSRAEEWAAAIEALFDGDRDRRVRLAARHAARHDWQVVLPQLVRRYEALMQQTPAVARRAIAPTWSTQPGGHRA